MEDDNTDRHLKAPQEANRDKHINFTAIERGDPEPSLEEIPAEKKNDKKEEKGNERSEDDKQTAGDIKGNAGIQEDDEAK